MTARAALIAAAGALAVGLAVGVTIEGWRLGAALQAERAAHAAELRQQAEAAASTLAEQQAARLALERRLQTIDTTHTQELAHVRAETARLAADLRAADRRLSIRTANPACAGVPAAAGAASVDVGAGRADIHAEDAAALVGIAGDADACAVTLAALQSWVRAVVVPPNVD